MEITTTVSAATASIHRLIPTAATYRALTGLPSPKAIPSFIPIAAASEPQKHNAIQQTRYPVFHTETLTSPKEEATAPMAETLQKSLANDNVSGTYCPK